MGIGMRVDEFAAILQQHYPKLGESPAAIERAITERMISLPAERIQARPGCGRDRQIRRRTGHSACDCLQFNAGYHRAFCALDGLGGVATQSVFSRIHEAGQTGARYLSARRGPARCSAGGCLALEDSRLGTQAALAAGMTLLHRARPFAFGLIRFRRR